MPKIKVKHFGPIQEGITTHEYLYFDDVTIFIGDQATGKSSIAKLISTITWLEKSLYKKELTKAEICTYNRFRKKYCAYQGIEGYFSAQTWIDYQGDYIQLSYNNGKTTLNVLQRENYLPPKIMYVPAERNFLSLVDAPERIKNLPAPLYTFLDEFELAKKQSKGNIPIPAAHVSFEYQKQNRLAYIKGASYKIKLSEASSGIQSLLPLYLVSKNLAENIGKDTKAGHKPISLQQETEIKKEINNILNNPKFNDEIKSLLIENLSFIYQNLAFVNIVEEPEQNLYPASQQQLLFELFTFKNQSAGNRLLITTHSPYILNFTGIATKARLLLDDLRQKAIPEAEITAAFADLFPLTAAIKAASLHIYEFLPDGSIRKLSSYNGIPSDDNFLNNSLQETNLLFDRLLEIEEKYDC